MTVYALDPLHDRRWPRFVERHPDASVFHTVGWLDALRRTYDYDPIAYTTSRPAAELTDAVVFCRVRSLLTGRRLVSLPFSDHSNPLVDSDETMREVLDFLERERHRAGWSYVELRPLRPMHAHTPGFTASATFVFHRIDLRRPLDILLRGFHRDCVRRKIERAEREQLTYESGRSEQLVRAFKQLLVLTCRRKRLPPQPARWFDNLLRCLGDNATIHVARKESRPIASILTLRFRRTLMYKYACSDARFHPSGAVQLPLWNAIQDAKRDGLEEVDLGRSDPKHQGLVTFKARWAATTAASDYLRCSAPGFGGLASETHLPLAQRCLARMPDWMRAVVGRLLYRHAG